VLMHREVYCASFSCLQTFLHHGTSEEVGLGLFDRIQVHLTFNGLHVQAPSYTSRCEHDSS